MDKCYKVTPDIAHIKLNGPVIGKMVCDEDVIRILACLSNVIIWCCYMFTFIEYLMYVFTRLILLINPGLYTA